MTRDRGRGSLPGGLDATSGHAGPAKQGERALGRMVRGQAADGHELGIYRAEPAGAPYAALATIDELYPERPDRG